MVQSTRNAARQLPTARFRTENTLAEITFPLTHVVGPLEVPYNIYTSHVDTFQNLTLCFVLAHKPRGKTILVFTSTCTEVKR